MLHPEKFIEQLQSVPASDWQELFAFFPSIEALAGAAFSMNPSDARVLAVSKPLLASIAKTKLIVPFAWERWEIGKKILSKDDFNYTTLDILTICKLITTIVKANRLATGVFAQSLADGSMLALLKAFKQKKEEMAGFSG
jgi:Family of unknown function (DUF6508)